MKLTTPATEHLCPRCGQLTAGAWSDGGIRWAICEECMEDDLRMMAEIEVFEKEIESRLQRWREREWEDNRIRFRPDDTKPYRNAKEIKDRLWNG